MDPLRDFKESLALPTLWFQTSSLQNGETINFCSIKTSEFVVICYGSHKKIIDPIKRLFLILYLISNFWRSYQTIL